MAEARPANRSTTTPRSPGGSISPQHPGQTPDSSMVAGQRLSPAPTPAGPPTRPAVQYLTAEELAHVYPLPDEEATPGDFEQAPASSEENRKAYPWQTPPRRPTSWFTLGDGVAPVDPALAAGPEALALAAHRLARE